MTFVIRPLTTDLWPSLETLFGPQGACYGCWCTYFRLAPKQREALSADGKKQVLKHAAEASLPPGLIAFDGMSRAGTPTAPCPDRWMATIRQTLVCGRYPASSSSRSVAGRGSAMPCLRQPSPMPATMAPGSSKPVPCSRPSSPSLQVFSLDRFRSLKRPASRRSSNANPVVR